MATLRDYYSFVLHAANKILICVRCEFLLPDRELLCTCKKFQKHKTYEISELQRYSYEIYLDEAIPRAGSIFEIYFDDSFRYSFCDGNSGACYIHIFVRYAYTLHTSLNP